MNGHSRTLYLLDSNIFLRALVRSNEVSWRECTQLLRAVIEKRIPAYIPTIVVAEIQFVLTSFYGLEKHTIVKAMKSLAAMPNLQYIEDVSLAVALGYFEHYNVKFIDCLLASSKLMQEGRGVIVSYDRDFDRLGIRRVEPGDLLKKQKQ